jgi:predicted ATPase with chaperone activity
MKAEPLPTLDRQEAALLRTAVKELSLSARTYAQILLCARKAADWAQADRIATEHVLDAIQFCTLAETP